MGGVGTGPAFPCSSRRSPATRGRDETANGMMERSMPGDSSPARPRGGAHGVSPDGYDRPRREGEGADGARRLRRRQRGAEGLEVLVRWRETEARSTGRRGSLLRVRCRPAREPVADRGLERPLPEIDDQDVSSRRLPSGSVSRVWVDRRCRTCWPRTDVPQPPPVGGAVTRCPPPGVSRSDDRRTARRRRTDGLMRRDHMAARLRSMLPQSPIGPK